MSAEFEAFQAAAKSCDLKLAVLGNCQMGHVTRCLQAMVGGDWPTNEWINFEILGEMADGRRDLTEYFAQHDLVFMQGWVWKALETRYERVKHKIVLYPNFDFLAYHPDLVYVTVGPTGAIFVGPCGHYQSVLALLAWKAGLDADDALKLYRRDIFQQLGFFDFWDSSRAALRAEGEATGLPMDDLIERWARRGCFMHSINHPKLFAIADVVERLLERLGIGTVPGNPMQYVRDYLADSVVWPVYPEVGEHLGIPGNYSFKLSAPGFGPDGPVRTMGLEDVVRRSFAAFSAYAPQDLLCNRLDLPPYRQLMEVLRTADGVRDLVDCPDSAELAWIDEARMLFKPGSASW